MKKIKIGIVNYLNTKPFLYGLKNANLFEAIELIEDYPTNISNYLIEDKIDIGLVSSVILPQIKTPYLFSEYCIASKGNVASVGLFANEKIDNIKAVFLDYQSKTSVELLKILYRNYWKKTVEYIETTGAYEDRIRNEIGGLVIGDRAFAQRKKSLYIYDLGRIWDDFCGMPFVYAVWVANKKLDDGLIEKINAALKFGVENVEKIVKMLNYPFYDLAYYYTQNIQFPFDEKKKAGLNYFLDFL